MAPTRADGMPACFAPRLKEALDKTSKSRKQVAYEAGISYGALSCYVRGVRNPTTCNLVSLCKSLGVCADWLLGLR